MLIRLATAEDAPAIAAIYEPIVRDTSISFETEAPDAGEVARRISGGMPAYPWLVATEDGAMLGYAYASRHRSRSAYRWAVDVSVYVDASYQRRGVGSRLYAVLIDLLSAQGYRNAFAGIALPNPASVGLHESAGFAYLGTYERVGWKNGRWHDVGWWQLSLGTGEEAPAEPRALDELDADALAVPTAIPDGGRATP